MNIDPLNPKNSVAPTREQMAAYLDALPAERRDRARDLAAKRLSGPIGIFAGGWPATCPTLIADAYKLAGGPASVPLDLGLNGVEPATAMEDHPAR